MKMNKNILLTGLVVAAGLFVARPSSAQLVAGGNINVVNGSTTEGTFNVLATQSSPGSDVWNIAVKWVADVSVTNDYIDDVQLKFSGGGTVTDGSISSNEFLQTITSGTGSVGATNWSPFVHTSGTEIEAQDPNSDGPPPTGAVDAAESFTGQVTLNGASNPITAIEFTLSNNGGGTEWFAASPATPEGSSFALLLPGLIPLAMMLRKRRRA
jgi:hypothetical protein